MVLNPGKSWLGLIVIEEKLTNLYQFLRTNLCSFCVQYKIICFTDVDECMENHRICLFGRCDNTLGSYRCICDRGFTVSSDSTFCTDMNECADTSK